MGLIGQPANPLAPSELGKFKKNLVAAVRILGGLCFLEGILGGLSGGVQAATGSSELLCLRPEGTLSLPGKERGENRAETDGMGRDPSWEAPTPQSPWEPLRVGLSGESSGWLSPCVG